MAHNCVRDWFAREQASDDEDNAENSDVLNCAARGDPMKEFNKTSRFNRIYLWTLVRVPPSLPLPASIPRYYKGGYSGRPAVVIQRYTGYNSG